MAAGYQAFLAWVDRRSFREPTLAAYVLAGMSGAEIDARRLSLAGAAPKVIARGLRGLTDPVSWRLRRLLLEAAPAEVALSLEDTLATTADAWTLRELLADPAPAAVATSLDGLDDETAWALRAELYPRAPEAVLASLALLDSPRAWELRARWISEGGGLDRACETYERARALARSVTGLDGAQAWEMRKAARDNAPVAALASLRGATSDRAWSWREKAIGRAPKAVLSTIAGMDDTRAWALRVANAPRVREALDSMAGLDHPIAWDLRETCLDIWPANTVKSLGVLVNGARGHDLLVRALAAHPDQISLLKQAADRRDRRQPHPRRDGRLTMGTFDLNDTLGLDSMGLGRFEVVLIRLVIAAALGSFLGFRLWRRLIPTALPPAREVAQAQTLIAVAGALMVVVIGHSTARAFGLVGLGGFIRFRSGIKDTRDAAIMFVMIGIGMACGLGAVPMAAVATLFAAVILALFDMGRRARLKLTRMSITVATPRDAWGRIRSSFPGARLLELPGSDVDVGRLVIEAVLGETMDATEVMRRLDEAHVTGVKTVCLDEGKGGQAAV